MQTCLNSRIVYSRFPEVLWHICVSDPVAHRARRRSLGSVEVAGVARRRASLTEAEKSKQDQSQHDHRKYQEWASRLAD